MMSDATLPPPRSSSILQASDDRNSSETNSGDASIVKKMGPKILDDKEDATPVEAEGRTENKQKRKRTR